MNVTHVKVLGIAVAAVILSTMVYFSMTDTPIIQLQEAYPEYSVSNFGSYQDFNDYLDGTTSYPFYGSSSRNEMVLGSPEPSFDDSSNDMKGTGTESSDYSDTNIQELGVDEPDIVKTDGMYLYVIGHQTLYIIYAYPAEDARIVATVSFNDSHQPRNLFIDGDRLVVITQSYQYYVYGRVDGVLYEDDEKDASSSVVPYWEDTTSTYVMLYDVSDREHPMELRSVRIGGTYSAARMIDSYVYVITTQYEYNRLYGVPEEPYIPKVEVDSVLQDIPLQDIYYSDNPDSSQTMTNVISLSMQDETAEVQAEVFLLGYSSTIYVSQDFIYITSVSSSYDYTTIMDMIYEYVIPILPGNLQSELDKVTSLTLDEYQKTQVTGWIIEEYVSSLTDEQKLTLAQELLPLVEKTVIYKIGINEGAISYETQGTVPGTINNQFSMSEYDGNLRVATTIHGWMIRSYLPSVESYNNVYVLDESLLVIGSIESIAPDETIYSARFIDDICYLVTFEQIDPFFVIDLSDPTNPMILGQLKIPGYSSYLHPYDETHVIGIGKEDSNVKISLFDVTDVENPVELSKYLITDDDESSYSWTSSSALYEHKAFLFDEEKQLLIFPASDEYKESAYVFHVDTANDIELKGVISHIPENVTVKEEEPYGYYWKGYYGYSILRSLYIGDVIYTISDAMVQMNDMDSLEEMNRVSLE